VLLAGATRFHRRNLPHLEVAGGRYFITVRAAGSLPSEVVACLLDIRRELCAAAPQSEQLRSCQRRYFQTMEKYLDREARNFALRNPAAAAALVAEFASLSEWGVEVPHYSIMPNHWHALLVPQDGCVHSLSEIMKRLKGRSAKAIRQQCGGRGPVWQREWFDRWIRDEAEGTRVVNYIRNNPVKAGLAREWRDHPWTR